MQTANPTYHLPVLLQQSVNALAIKPNGTYVDCTFGGGGHSLAILNKLGPNGRLIAFDQDENALQNAMDDSRLTLINHNYAFLKHFLDFYNITKIDGLLADLGVSSEQINAAERGFAHRFNAALDMRMSVGIKLSAADVLNTYSQANLGKLLQEFGELKDAWKMSLMIVEHRKIKPFLNTLDLNLFLATVHSDYLLAKNLSKVYQALRIEVNKEIDSIRQMLLASIPYFNVGARLVIISYHSLEDRLAKQFISSGNLDGIVAKDFYGNKVSAFKSVGKLIVPTAEEIAINNRARSAKMRVAEII